MKEELRELIKREDMGKGELMTLWVLGALERMRTWGILKGVISKEVSEKGNLVWLALDEDRTEVFQMEGAELAYAFTLGLLVNEGLDPESSVTKEIANLIRDFYSDSKRYNMISEFLAFRLQ